MTYFSSHIAPSGPPTSFVSSSVGTESAVLSWSLPEQQKRNGIVNGYNLQCQETCGIIVVNVTTRDIDISISNLRPATQYECKVSAFTAVGEGPWAVMNFTTNSDGNSQIVVY